MIITNDYINLKSVTAEYSHSKTSNKYAFVPTLAVIKLMEKNEWFVSSARETNVQPGRQGFQKHMIRFKRQDDMQKTLQINEIIPEIQLTNAHDGGSAFNLMSALFRCFCSNQCTVSDSTIASHRILHKGYTDEKILEAVYHIVEDTPKVLDSVNKFKNIPLNKEEQRIFGESALQLMYKPEQLETKFDRSISVDRLLVPKRTQDQEQNLWNTYNIVQEKFLKGDRFMVEKKEINEYYNKEFGKKYAKAKKTKEIKSIDRDIKLNKALWTLTEAMSTLKTA